MKSIYKNIVIAFSLAGCFTLASASDLIGTAESIKGGLALEVGFANDGGKKVSGIQFDIKLDSKATGSFENADLSSCLSGLPKAFSASSCTVIDESTLRVVILSMSGDIIPSTILGTISLPGNSGQSLMAGAPGAIKFGNVVMGDAAGGRIEPGLVDFSSNLAARDDFKGQKREFIRPGN